MCKKPVRCQTLINETQAGIQLCFGISAQMWYKLFAMQQTSSQVQDFHDKATKALSPTEHLPDQADATDAHESYWGQFCSKAAKGDIKAAKIIAGKIPKELFCTKLQAVLTGAP